MWSELFPDAPAWVPWAALIMNAALVLLILAVFVANPVIAWQERKFREEEGVDHPGLSKSSRELLGMTLMGVAVKVDVDDKSD